ncbi:BTB/POZ domain-containing protein [Rhynchospora pubera]|uniref:BTB/POZ domain-containing protein n=1 Tax=Rhynchospora pubera TaxID=906938 RepID=A0AAV8F3M4_9POAL|nr:BTB/POZ domain-containing protein [Rhynchospora pubera]
MACLKLGSRPGTFRREGNDWYCTTGLRSDLLVKFGEASFHLHKFPLVSKSGLFETLISEKIKEGEQVSLLELHDFPFGIEIFELCAKFCYSFKFELNASNVIPLCCASENLKMNEEISEGNLRSQTHKFLHNSVLKSWRGSIQALQSCNNCMKAANNLHILEHCVKSVSEKCLSTQQELVNQHFSWNGIQIMHTGSMKIGVDIGPSNSGIDWWYVDVATLPLPLFVEVISQLETLGMDQEIITGSMNYYAMRSIPGLNRREFITEPNNPLLAKQEQRTLVEEIEKILPFQKGTSSCKLLFGLLKCAKLLKASNATMYNLERRIGTQLDEANLEDLLIPNFSNSAKDETMYDVDCVHRILRHFLTMDKMINVGVQSEGNNEDVQLLESNRGVQLAVSDVNSDAVIRVSYLVDAYLAEVASDSNLKSETFSSFAAAIPEYARVTCDMLYSAIDIYLKAHPWLTDPVRESLWRLVDCQKLSPEACTHAVQNSRLPLRTIIQVLFFEQLQLHRLVTDYLLISDENPDHVHQQPGLELRLNRDLESMWTRVVELEKECGVLHRDIERLECGSSHRGVRLGAGFGSCRKRDDVVGSTRAWS